MRARPDQRADSRLRLKEVKGAAERCGVGAFVGRVILSINGAPIAKVKDIKAASAGQTSLTLRFAPTEAKTAEQIRQEEIAKANRGSTPPRAATERGHGGLAAPLIHFAHACPTNSPPVLDNLMKEAEKKKRGGGEAEAKKKAKAEKEKKEEEAARDAAAKAAADAEAKAEKKRKRAAALAAAAAPSAEAVAAGIVVGAKVRVKAFVREPKYGWNGLPSRKRDAGVVVSGNTVTVDFDRVKGVGWDPGVAVAGSGDMVVV
eukprot:gene27094-58245_t